MLSIIKQLTERPAAKDRVLILNLENREFLTVKAEIWSEGHHLPIKIKGQLPCCGEIVELYDDWRSKYNIFQARESRSYRIKIKSKNTHYSNREINELAE